MIQCLLDTTIEGKSPCFFCCCYCDEKECPFRCDFSNRSEENIAKSCRNAVE